ncbi:MAG TPA: PepSY-associated TM helix domain-containing protein [Balneolaceae bacterium]
MADKKKNRKFWIKLHLYLGLIPGIPLLLIGLTGVLLAFAPEIRVWDQPQFFAVQPEGEMKPIPELVHQIESEYPKTNLLHIALFEKTEHTWTIYATGPVNGKHQFHRMHVNPYTGSIKVDTTSGGWAQWIEELHRNLTAGTTGRYVVGISSIFLMILCLSGLYLWFPLRKGMWKRLRNKNDALSWHMWTGLIVLPILIIMAFTGLTLTFGDAIYSSVFWVTGSPALPEEPTSTIPKGDVDAISMADAVRIIQRKRPNMLISGIGGATDSTDIFVFHLGYKNDLNPRAWVKVYVDQYSGKIIGQLNSYEHSLGAMYKQTWWMWHTGEFFGFAGRIFWALISLTLPALAITGLFRWMSKKNRFKRLKACFKFLDKPA